MNIIEFIKSFLDLFKQAPSAVELRDFATLADLEAWFDLHKELRLPSPNLCDDYSRESRRLAEVDGYFCTPHLVYQGSVYGTMVFDSSDFTDGTNPFSVYHIANLAIVLNDEAHDGKQSCYYCDLSWNKLIYLTSFISGGTY